MTDSIPTTAGSAGQDRVTDSAATVTIPEDVYDALLRLAAVHKRQVCDCENCTPEKAFPYDDCGCGHDWMTCIEDVYVIDAYVPNWRDQP